MPSTIEQTWKSIMARKNGTAGEVGVPLSVQDLIDNAELAMGAAAHEAYPDSLPGRLHIYKEAATNAAAKEAEAAGEKFNPNLFAKYFHQYMGVKMRAENVLPPLRYTTALIEADAIASASCGD